MRRIDLHVHSNCSDGTYSPTELVDYAVSKGLLAFALTDHDTTMGIATAVAYAALKNIEVIPGIELSTDYLGHDIHILGLYINPIHPILQQHLVSFINSREERNRKMCDNLRALGIDISTDQLKSEFQNSVITRAHYARYLYNHKYVKSIPEAFKRYVGDDCPSYVHRNKVTPNDAVSLILAAGGIPVLAHPVLYHLSDSQLDELVNNLKASGLMGIEAVYSTYSLSEEHAMKRLASKYELLITGGSDFHGLNKPDIDLSVGYGKLFVPDELLIKLKQAHLIACPYLLAIDMDGTLLDSQKKVSPHTRQALYKCVESGNRLLISTGRPLKSLLMLIEQNQLSMKGLILSAFNGGLICDFDTMTILLSKTISKENVRITRDLAKEEGLHFHAYTLDDIVSERDTPELHYYCSYVNLPYEITNDLAGANFPEPFKVFSIHLTNHERLVTLRNKIEAACADSLQCVFSDSVFLEILPKNSGKGESLSFVSSYLSIPLSNIYAFGDAENDLSMLKIAGHSIAMKNASDCVKEEADTITAEDNDHDGLIPYFQMLTKS